MKHYYSATTGGFYLGALKADYERTGTWPSDAIEVTKEEWQTYSAQPPAGQQLGADANGRPAWVPIPAASLKELAAAALSRINAGYTATIAKILNEYPDAETLSFDKQEQQARAWDNWQQAGSVPNDEPATPYLDALLSERPIGKSELVVRILAKADQFETMHGAATGRRQRLEDEINAALEAEDRETLEAITW